MADLKNRIGLSKDGFEKSKGLAEKLVRFIGDNQPQEYSHIEVLTALGLIAGGFIHKFPEEHHEAITKIMDGLVRTSIKTYGFCSEKRPTETRLN